MQETKPSVEGTIKTSTGIPQVEPQARVTPEVAPAFPQVEKPSLEVSTETVPFETVHQADPTLPKGQTNGADCWPKWGADPIDGSECGRWTRSSQSS